MATAIESADVWLSAPKAAKRIGKSEDFVRGLVRDGLVTTRQVSGRRWEVSAVDLDRLMVESVRPAIRGGASAVAKQPIRDAS